MTFITASAGTAIVALSFLSCLCADRCVAAQVVAAFDSAESVAAGRALLAAFDDAGRKLVGFSFDAPERKRWRRDPSPRPGLALKDMTEVQRALTDQLLKTVLSDAGFSCVTGIRQEQDLLARDEGGLGAGYYWLAIYGNPGEGRWAWRFGGHHVSLHVTYDGNRIVSVSPIHLGGEMAGRLDEGWKGYEQLRFCEVLGRRAIEAAEPQSLPQVLIGDVASGRLEWSEPQNRPLDPPETGLPLSRMTAQQRAIAQQLVEEYLSVFEAPIARTLEPKLDEGADGISFCWSGSRSPEEAHYYRFLGKGFLIEYVNTGAHIHTVLRTATDWGESAAAP